jgi:hypothetical protein
MTPPDLTKLHDFYQPPSPSWMPQTMGWYVLFALLCLVALWMIARAVSRWFANRYRREALQLIATTPASQLSALLKRAALVAWPRNQVAALTGDKWIDFLAQSSGIDAFKVSPGNQLEDAAISTRPVAAQDATALRKLAEKWVRTHHV